jgi:hypothetical protein
MNRVGHGLIGVPDAGAFLARLTRLDASAPVRLRRVTGQTGAGGRAGRTALWAPLPWQALVTRTVRGDGPDEATVSAADLLSALSVGDDRLPPRRDADWRWALPTSQGQVVETVGAAELVDIARAAAGTLRTAATARRVGERMVRDALLDHVAIVVTAAAPGAVAGSGAGGAPASGAAVPGRVEVPQRLVQAVVRMGFLGTGKGAADEPVQVRIAGRWVGLAAPYGTAWLQKVNQFSIRPIKTHTNG